MRKYTGAASVVVTLLALGVGWLVEPIPTQAQQKGPAPIATKVATADDLPEIGQCRPTAAQPACNDALTKYRTAFVALVKETENFYIALRKAFGTTLWTGAVEEKAKGLKTKLDGADAASALLKAPITKLEANAFGKALDDARTKLKTYDQKKDDWTNDPLKDGNRKAFQDARDAYTAELRNVFGYADSYQSLDQQFTPILESIAALKKMIEDAQAIIKSAELTNYAAELRKLAQPARETLHEKFQAAENALKEAVLAGVELKKKDPPAGKDIIISGAIYGDDQVTLKLKMLLDSGVKAEELPDRLTKEEKSSVCQAAAYVKGRCEYDRNRFAWCTKVDGTDWKACAPEGDFKFNRNEIIKYDKRPRTICDIPVKLTDVCGGGGNPAPTSNRELLVVYKCGPLDEENFMSGRDNTSVFLLCE